MIKNKNILIVIFVIFVILIILIILIEKIIKFCIYDNRINKNKLRLVQYNVDFLFTKSKIINCPGNGCKWKNNFQAHEHFLKISNIISKLNPDIITLCEINTMQVLNKLKTLLNDESYNCYLSKSNPNFIDQNLGLITRIEPLSLYKTQIIQKYPIYYSSLNSLKSGITNIPKHFISKFHINNIDIIIICVHLKAYPFDIENGSIREAQSIIIQKIILDYYENFEIIVMGDFNDFDNENRDHKNDKPISKVLDIIKGNNGYNPINYKLYNVSELIKQDKRETCIISEEKSLSMIDHILVTNNLRKHITNVQIFTEYNGIIGENYNSDHYPLVVDFDFNK